MRQAATGGMVLRMNLALVLALVLGGLLPACSSLAPEAAPRPAINAGVAGTFADGPRDTSAKAADALAWQQFFQDEALRKLVGVALNNNRDLRLSALAIEQARAQMQLREADLWPTVNFGLSGSRQPNGAGGLNSLYLGGLQVTAWEADLFGRLRNLGDAAAAQFLATQAQQRATQISLVSSVAQAWLNLQADEALLQLTQLTLASREQTLALTLTRQQLGATSMGDVRAAESLLEAARVSLAQQRRQKALDENALTLLLGTPLSTAGVTLAPLKGLGAFPALDAGLPSEVLQRRPDVQAAEQQLMAAQANIGAARAAFFPRITLTGSVGSATRDLGNLFSAGTFAWGFAPALLQPLFDAGRNEANLAVAQAVREQAVAQYEKAIQQAFREVADALASRSGLLAQLQAQEAQVRAEQARAELADLRYRHGASSFLEVLDAQRSLLASQLALVQVQGQATQSLVSLYKVLGGGWN